MNKGACVPMSSCSDDMGEGERFEEEESRPTGGNDALEEQKRPPPPSGAPGADSNFRRSRGHPAAQLETRLTGETVESLQDEDERGRMSVGLRDSRSFSATRT